MVTFTDVYDACVLYSARLRDLLMHLALVDLYRARWTDQIHDEWIRNLMANRPDLKREQLERTRDLMNRHVLDCLVTGYEPLIDGLDLPDPEDRHVLAAAIRSGAAVIVTFNLNDFPASMLSPLGIEAQHPDEFITHQLNLNHPGAVCLAIKRHRASLLNPPKSVDDYLEDLAIHLPVTVSHLRDFAELL